ncbi:MAG: hypothetical protein M3Z20_20345 [Chloroflexota bacterium]|nr:hypothetical protein [Chloroflexota bacterium]
MSALRQPTPPADPPPVAALPATSREVLKAIRAAYTFVDATNEAEALGILAQRPDVSSVLLAALPHVREIFGDDTRVLLIATNHYDGRPSTLSARIAARGSLSEQLAKQDEFFQAWWLDAGDAVFGELTFGV